MRTLVNLLLVLLVLLGTDQNLWEYGTRQWDFSVTKIIENSYISDIFLIFCIKLGVYRR